MKRFFCLACLLCLLPMAARADIKPAERMSDPVLQARAEALYTQLRCVVCQSQSIADSDSEMAAALRATVRQRLLAGDSDNAVLAYAHSRYGDKVLMKPPFAKTTWVLWLLPVAFFAGGSVLAAGNLRRKS